MKRTITDHICWICGSARFVDAHHYDCKEGKISPETVDLCRRCHRTYHDRGIGWFDEEYLVKAISIENRRRQFIYDHLSNSTKPLVLLRHQDIQRSNYWNKVHGVSKPNKAARETKEQRQLSFEMIDQLLREVKANG